MGRNIFVAALLISMVVYEVNCRSIDEIISSAGQGSGRAMSSNSELPSNDVRVELDMLFSAEEYARIQRLDAETTQGGRKKRKAIRYESRRWNNKVILIPYLIEDGVFGERDQAQFEAAVNDWSRHTCLDFRPFRNGDLNYIKIQDGAGCSSYVGMKGGSQNLTLARVCREKGVILHQIGHALGLYHEQNRPDRDRFVQVNNINILHGMEHNFQRRSTSVVSTYGVPYDYLSIMHYGKTAFSKDGNITIRTLDPTYQNLIGNSQELTFRDIKLANLMYNCGSQCRFTTCPGDGFIGKDCRCYCLGNPTKLCSWGGGGGTVYGYSHTTNKKREGGIRSRTNISLEECAALCTTDTDCAAFDYNERRECWTHTRTNECWAAFAISNEIGSERYVKNSACINYAPPTFSGYMFVGQFGLSGGTEVANRPTEALCIESCSEDVTCQSIDFNFKDSRCYKHTKTTCCDTKSPCPDVHRYTRNAISCHKICGSTSLDTCDVTYNHPSLFHRLERLTS